MSEYHAFEHDLRCCNKNIQLSYISLLSDIFVILNFLNHGVIKTFIQLNPFLIIIFFKLSNKYNYNNLQNKKIFIPLKYIKTFKLKPTCLLI